MFYMEIKGKKILYTGDFRAHGIIGEKDRLDKILINFVPNEIDYLFIEGTMLSREKEAKSNSVTTESELGKEAYKLMNSKKNNFVLISSTNLDSIMEIFHNVPEGKTFICDHYQASVMLTAMKGMEKRGNYPNVSRK